MLALIIGRPEVTSWVQNAIEMLFRAANQDPPMMLTLEALPCGSQCLQMLDSGADYLILADLSETLAEFESGGPTSELWRSGAAFTVLMIELCRLVRRSLSLEGDQTEKWQSRLATFFSLSAGDWIPTCRSTLQEQKPCAPYFPSILDAEIKKRDLHIIWPRECFFNGDAPGEPLPLAIPIAGRARILAYGPYLPLPAGDWCVTATLGFSPEVGRMPFIFEVDLGESLSRGFFETEGAGFFRIKLSFGVKKPLQAIEMRLISQDSALEGDVSLVEVELTQSRL